MEEMVNQPGDNQAESASAPQAGVPNLTQEQINEIVSSRHKAGYEKGRKEAMAELEALKAQQMPGNIDELIQQKVSQMQAEQANLAYAQRVFDEFANKMQAAEERYPDMQEKLRESELSEMPEIIPFVNAVDNSGDVMYELLSNPHKAITIATAIRNKMPGAAKKELNKLSKSIQANQKAAQAITAKEPLSQVKPSSAGGDNGKMSVNDFRKAKYLRR
jgi:hypothetical protein